MGNQRQSQSQGKQKKRGTISNEETLEGTVDGVDVSATLDDDDELSASAVGDDILETYSGEDTDEGDSPAERGRDRTGNIGNKSERH